jgi:hypothetical protein
MVRFYRAQNHRNSLETRRKNEKDTIVHVVEERKIEQYEV